MKRLLSLLASLLFCASVEAGHCCYQPQLDCQGPSLCCTLPCAVYDTSWIGMNGFFGEFIYWNMYSDEFNWATQTTATTTTTTTATTSIANKSTIYNHKFDFAPGFRLGFHHIFPCTENDMTLSWTYYWNSDSSSVSGESSVGNVTIDIESPYIVPVANALTDMNFNSSLTFRLNRFDFTFGQNAQFWNCIVINYYGGGVFWSTNEDLSVHALFTDSGTIVDDQTSRINTSYRGVGAQVGLRLNWNLWQGLVLSANGGFAGTVGPFDLNLNKVESSPANGTDTATQANNTYWTGRYAANLGLVVRYSFCVSNQCVLYSSLGWEYFQYFNQTAFQVTSSAGGFVQSSANLEVHGLTFAIGTTF